MTNPNDPYTRDPQYRDPAMTTRDGPYAENAQARRADQWGAGSWVAIAVAVLVVIGLIYAFSGPWADRTNSINWVE